MKDDVKVRALLKYYKNKWFKCVVLPVIYSSLDAMDPVSIEYRIINIDAIKGTATWLHNGFNVNYNPFGRVHIDISIEIKTDNNIHNFHRISITDNIYNSHRISVITHILNDGHLNCMLCAFSLIGETNILTTIDIVNAKIICHI